MSEGNAPGGKAARAGFHFQDAMVLLRLLRDARDRRAAKAFGEPESDPLIVRIEATAAPDSESATTADDQKTEQPSWDSVYITKSQTIIDEAKLSGLDKEDRFTFYKRIRQTYKADPTRTLYPRITAKKDTLQDYWKQLAGHAASARPHYAKSVDSAAKLASEALKALTMKTLVYKKKPIASGDQLSRAAARQLLQRFKVDDNHTIERAQEELEALLEDIGAEHSAEQARLMLHGWIDQKAREKAGPFDITVNTLIEQLEFVSRYLNVPAKDEQLWNRIFATPPPPRDSQIPRQSRTVVQPSVQPFQTAAERIAIIGVAGTGKSELLRELYDECSDPETCRVWIDVTTAADCEEAVAFGAWACAHKERPLKVFVESLDHVAAPSAMLGKIERALGQHPGSIYAAVRPTTWTECNAQATWTPARLTSWTTDIVKETLSKLKTPPIPDDLLEVLRTPLFLDLFIRTFQNQTALPAGIASRQGVLDAFFNQKVLRSGHADSAQLRTALDVGAAKTLDSKETWHDVSPAALQLVALGVVTNAYGECTFRHALLRDFAVALHLSTKPMKDVVAALKRPADPTLRNDSLRALIDMWLARGHRSKLRELGLECAAADFGTAFAIALGCVEAPTLAMLSEVAELDDGAIFLQAADRAVLEKNIGWINALAGPASRPRWLLPGRWQLRALDRIAEFAVTLPPTHVEAFATSIRAWTHGLEPPTLRLIYIFKLLAQVLPDNNTLKWIVALPTKSDSSKFTKQPLRALLTSRAPLEPTLAIAAASHLMFCEDGSRTEQDIDQNIYELLHEHESRCVLTARPSVAIPLLLKASVLRTTVEEKREGEWLAESRARQDNARREFEAPKDASSHAIKRPFSLLRRFPLLSLFEAVGNLVDDGKRNRPTRMGVAVMLDICRATLQGTPPSDEEFYQYFAAAALDSESVLARTILLEISTSKADMQTVTTLVEDHRMYHFMSTHKQLGTALRTHWTSLPDQTKKIVQQNILGVASSPLAWITSVGTLARAIACADRTAELLPYIAANDHAGLDAMHSQGLGLTTIHRTRFGIVSDALAEQEHTDSDLGHGDNVATTTDRYDGYVKQIRRVHDESTMRDHIVDDMLENCKLTTDLPPELWIYISLRIRELHTNPIEPDQARSLFDLALVCATAAFHRDECAHWENIISVASLAAKHDAYKDNLEWRERLFAAVVEAAGLTVERQDFGAAALRSVDASHWFSNGPGPVLFETWVTNYMEAEGLVWAIWYLWELPPTRRIDILRTTAERIASTDQFSVEYCRKMGACLAFDCFWDAHSPGHDLLRDWNTKDARPALLQSKPHWASLLQQYAWQLGHELAESSDEPANDAAVNGFARLATQVWEMRSPCDAKDIDACSVLRPLHNDYAGPARPWPRLLSNLTASILVENAGALYGIAWDRFDVQSIEPVASAILDVLAKAATQRDDHYDIVDAAVKVGVSKVLRSTAQALQAALERIRATKDARTIEKHLQGLS